MYLLISDRYALESERLYITRNDVSYERIKQVSPPIVDIFAEDIEEIIIYAIRNTNGGLKVKTADCADLSTDETSIRVDYGKMQEYDEICKNVRGRLFGNLVRSGRIKNNEFTPDIVLIDNIKDYNYIKAGKSGLETENRSWFDKANELVANSDWNGIIDMSPHASEIEQSDFWDDAACLSKISFALSKLASKSTRKMRPDEKQKRQQYEDYFLKVVSRCIELEPHVSMHKSTLAYFYYNSYISYRREDFFEKALSLYKDLAETSYEKYKELYRYAGLLRYHLDTYQRDNKYTAEWFKEVKSITDKYVQLVEDYGGLSEERQKKYKKYYIAALFSYAKVNIDQFLKRAWDHYFNSIYAKVLVRNYYKDDTQMQRIDTSVEYLRRALELTPDRATRDNLDDNPNYFELRYRLAQIEQIKGITLLMRGKPIEQCQEYFENSVKFADDALNTAKEIANNGVRGFKFPDYAKPIKAISLYFLKDYIECHRCFYKAAPYMLYEEAKIFVLCNQSEEALRILSEIPENDKCRNKANKLRDNLKGK